MSLEPNQTSSIHIETELSRDLGMPTALAIGVGTMIAAGIFTLSGKAILLVDASAIIAFLLAAFVALFTALTYCEFVSIYPQSGEGYLYTRKTFPPLAAYFVGWALFLGYSSSCAFYIASLSTYFREFIWDTKYYGAFGGFALVILTLLNVKGTKESGMFQIVITVAKVLLLCWFIIGGLSAVDTQEISTKFSNDVPKIFQASAMVFITFFGFSAIAASAGEIKNPGKTITRAIFLSMLIVTILYCLVVIVMVAANLDKYDEAAMGTVAKLYLGPVGGMVIVAGGMFSMISATNASIMAGSRVMLSMSRLGHFPSAFGSVSSRTGTPIVSLFFVGGTILIFNMGMNLDDLTHFANTVLLIALSMVNLALIFHRRKFPEIERPFRVPLVPFVPILGTMANLYLLYQITSHPAPFFMAILCLIMGVMGYLSWKGFASEEEALPGTPSRIALQKTISKGEHPFRVLVPLSNPSSVHQLIDMAAAIATERGGEVVALRVAVVPDQLPPSYEEARVEEERILLEQAHRIALQHNVPVTSLIRVGHNAARAILETAREHSCDLIIMGWKGYTTTKEKILGEVVDAVVDHARTDLMLVKQVSDQPLRKFLLPSAGGEHAKCAEDYIATLARQQEGSLTLCAVVPPDSSEEEVATVNERLAQSVDEITKVKPCEVDHKVIKDSSVSNGILEDASNYDAIVVGARCGRKYPNMLFGSVANTIAKTSKQTVILVKHHSPVKALIHRVIQEST